LTEGFEMFDQEDEGRMNSNEFIEESEKPTPGLIAELVDFLAHNKKWWLAPIIVVLLLVALLIVVSGSAPFIYTLF